MAFEPPFDGAPRTGRFEMRIDDLPDALGGEAIVGRESGAIVLDWRQQAPAPTQPPLRALLALAPGGSRPDAHASCEPRL